MNNDKSTPGESRDRKATGPRLLRDAIREATRDSTIAELPHGWLGDSWVTGASDAERPYTVTWRGERFRFEHLQDKSDLAHPSRVSAVSRRREFIGTMSCAEKETPKELEVRSVRWLAELLG